MKGSLRGIAASVAVTFAMLGSGASAQDRAPPATERAKVSYAIGMDVARSFEPVAQDIDLAAFERAVRNAFEGKEPLLAESETQAVDQALRANLAARSGERIPGAPPGTLPPPVDREKVGLMLGDRAVGPSLAPLKDDLDLAALMQAIRIAFAGEPPLLAEQEAQATLQAFMAQKREAMVEHNRTEGAAFLAANRGAKGVVTTPSGLQYMVLRPGNGPRPVASSTVRVNYEGKLLDGEVFDSSYQRGQPAEFGLDGVIPGWTEGLVLMPVGSKYRFWIPSELGYGANGAPGGKIGPHATLTFDVELLEILR